ncbi:MAG TPA: hypothetical protein EYP82_04105, partial [Hydrogenothermaceae bacterium]|nr:hypothetical protein [Hydrogenothermaceae bacterium]
SNDTISLDDNAKTQEIISEKKKSNKNSSEEEEIDNFNLLTDANIPTLDLALPLAISFSTFQQIHLHFRNLLYSLILRFQTSIYFLNSY